MGIQRVSGRQVRPAQNITDFIYVTAGVFETLQIPLLQGRVFTNSDNARAAKVMVVNEAFVRRYFGAGVKPIGDTGETGKTIYRVIGVVATVQEKNGWGSNWGPIDAFPQVYAPADQLSDDLFALANT